MYNYLSDLIDPYTIIYHFNPPGSRNLEDIDVVELPTQTWAEWMNSLLVIVHDQEPLNFDFYTPQYVAEHMMAWFDRFSPSNKNTFLKSSSVVDNWSQLNIGFMHRNSTLYDKNILLHSELRSPEVVKYEAVGLVGVYWWAHAIIARDWYRYAQHDLKLDRDVDRYQYDFNIYNRAWSGTREYRLLFTSLILENQLDSVSKIKFNPVDSGVHYHDHQFHNIEFRPAKELAVLEKNLSSATSSADYSSADYNECWFDVVLETLYDDPRLQLTEKVLRPIACGKPFILAATHGSLEYLRQYGFKTFGHLIDESYDLETDSVKRLHKIIKVMDDIRSLSVNQKQLLNLEIDKVTKHNRDLFFSEEFTKSVMQEFLDNYASARNYCQQHKTGRRWLEFRKLAGQDPSLHDVLLMKFHDQDTQQQLKQMLLMCRQR